ncbi:MAG: Hsp20/alpha crystallin family protein [Thermicanus sp.]|nr:Hsp20/alpha crystallin family protein [Thermicanus sp.]
MNLVPFDPFRHLENMKNELDRIFSAGFPETFSLTDAFRLPRVDVYESEKEVVVRCDLPGIEKKEDIHIEVSENHVSIQGTVQRMEEVKSDRMYRQERYEGEFQRSIPLPVSVKSDEAKASYRNGVLEIRIPKLNPEKRRKIDIDFQ